MTTRQAVAASDATDEHDRYRRALTVIAGRGCEDKSHLVNVSQGDLCLSRDKINAIRWCRSCTAARALGRDHAEVK